jgi:hypothetical protein
MSFNTRVYNEFDVSYNMTFPTYIDGLGAVARYPLLDNVSFCKSRTRLNNAVKQAG